MNHKVQTFLFNPVNRKFLSIFRILVGIALLIVFYERNLEPTLIYSIDFFDVEYFYKEIFTSSFYYLILASLLILFTIGWKCRITGLLLSFLLFPLIFMHTMHVSRQLILFALFCVSLYPSSFHLSLFKLNNSSQKVDDFPIWPIRLLQFQLSFLYLINAYSKTTYGYLNGEVLKVYSETLTNFLVDLSTGYLEIYSVLIPVSILAIGTVITEYFLAVGFWFKKIRNLTAVIGIIFHLSLMFVVKIEFLGFATLFFYLAFLIPFERKD